MTPAGRPSSLKMSTSHAAVVLEVSAGLRMTQLPVTTAAVIIPVGQGQREVPRGDHRAHSQGQIAVLGQLSRPRGDPIAVPELKRLAGVELHQIDGLRNLPVSLAPGLANLVDVESGQLAASATQYLGGAKQDRRALLDRGSRPAGDGRPPRRDRPLYVLDLGRSMTPDHLLGMSWVVGIDHLVGSDPLAPDQQGIIAAELPADPGQFALEPAAERRLPRNRGSARYGRAREPSEILL